ncbi:hypothetical protein [Serratia aquatilis]|uniref:Uncharacterized protein n=1 Tax=Serratia aquatilis TaxID=1737515 RepID=A0ABV6E8G3_9GAMM
MTGQTLRASGKRSIEIKLGVSFPERKGTQRYQTENYHIETWFFFPTSLQVNHWNYSPKQFQQLLKNYIRLRPPTIMLRKLADSCPVTLEEISRLIANDSGDNAATVGYEYRLKMFCLTFKRALHLEARYINKLSGEKREQALQNFTNMAVVILQSYRVMRSNLPTQAVANARHVVDYCDEYLAIVATRYGRKVLNSLSASPAYDELRNFWREEMLYRKENYLASFPSPLADNEQVVYRLNTLKKYISSPMYLDIRRRRGETILAHTIAGTAAAIAMIFATGVAFFWQGKYGALSFQLFLAMVIGYIFKDRMKEGFRARLFSTFRRWLPDRQQIIYKNLRQPVGRCNESFVFVDEQHLPTDIKTMRHQVHRLDIQNYYRSEDILHYSKHVRLRHSNQLFSGMNRSIMDITRLDIMPFLTHTDELHDEMPTLDDDNVVYGEKVYHINIIRRVTDGNKECLLERARIVVNSEGIKRIEPVLVAKDPGEEQTGTVTLLPAR